MENDSSETAELLQRAAGGDADACADLFARHRELIRRAVALRLDRRVAARVDASDVVQETYLEALRRFPDYLSTRPLPFVLWLRWLARERVLGLHRQHLHADRRAVTREAPAPPADASSCLVSALLGRGPTPSAAAAAAEAIETLRRALGRLDDDERDLILWRHFEHLSNREIARLLGVSEAAAAKRYIRALERLRGLLTSPGPPGA